MTENSQLGTSLTLVPDRPLFFSNMQEEQIHRIGRGMRKDVDVGQPSQATTGTPLQVYNVLATESPSKQQDRTYSLVSVQFIRVPNDPAFSGVRIWLTGYQGNTTTPVLVAEGGESPVSFLVETTGETVVVTVQAVGGTNTFASFASSPTAVVDLDGVTSAPPAPTINQYLLAITYGLQFRFNYLAGQVADVIDGYWIYRNSINSSATATQYKYVKHSPLNMGAYTFQDNVGAAATWYYWVTSVNTQGLESALVDAQTSGVPSGGAGTTTIYRPTASSGAWNNRPNAYDANNATSSNSGGQVSSSATSTWSGFAAGPGAPTALTLKILWADSPGGAGDTFTVTYSINGGAAFLAWFSDTSGTTATNTLALGLAQDLTQVQVKAVIQDVSGAGSSANVYEIWIEAVS